MAPAMLTLIGVSLAGCATNDGDGCRGRAPIYLSAGAAAAMTRAEKEAVVASNEALERQCGAKPLR